MVAPLRLAPLLVARLRLALLQRRLLVARHAAPCLAGVFEEANCLLDAPK